MYKRQVQSHGGGPHLLEDDGDGPVFRVGAGDGQQNALSIRVHPQKEVYKRQRRDSTRFVDTLITASPEFFKQKSPKEIQEFFQRAADFLIGRVWKENIVSAVVHMDEKTPHLHLVFVPVSYTHLIPSLPNQKSTG